MKGIPSVLNFTNQIITTCSPQPLNHLLIDYTLIHLSNAIWTRNTELLRKQPSWKPDDGINVSVSSLETESGVKSAPILPSQKGTEKRFSPQNGEQRSTKVYTVTVSWNPFSNSNVATLLYLVHYMQVTSWDSLYLRKKKLELWWLLGNIQT